MGEGQGLCEGVAGEINWQTGSRKSIVSQIARQKGYVVDSLAFRVYLCFLTNSSPCFSMT